MNFSNEPRTTRDSTDAPILEGRKRCEVYFRRRYPDPRPNLTPFGLACLPRTRASLPGGGN